MVEFKTSEQCRVELVAHTQCTFGVDDWETADFLPVSAARASFQKEDKTGVDQKADKKLLKFLCDEEHFGVFEHNTVTFIIECPLFIRSQIQRHRTFSYNEWSRRYTDQKIAFWIPDKWRKQSQSNKQASTNESVDLIPTRGSRVLVESDGGYSYLLQKPRNNPSWFYEVTIREALDTYNEMIEGGVSREQARAILPQSLLTQFYMSGNLRNWAHFIKLRKDSHAQYEVQVIARRIEEQLRSLWPNATEYLFK